MPTTVIAHSLYRSSTIIGALTVQRQRRTRSLGPVTTPGMSRAPTRVRKSPTAATPLPVQLESFLTHFATLYGASRWYHSLLPALMAPTRHCAMINRWGSAREVKDRVIAADAVRLAWTSLECYEIPAVRPKVARVTDIGTDIAAVNDSEIDSVASSAISALTLTAATAAAASTKDDSDEDANIDADNRFPPPFSAHPSTLCLYYLLDAASLMPVQALQLSSQHSVLDLCAAPGGKALAILQTMFANTRTHNGTNTVRGTLTCNEWSASRRKRLQRVIESYVPESHRRYVSVTGHSALENHFLRNRYDRVLVDAPCSSERHLLHDPSQLLSYTSARTRHHSATQLTMLVNAIHYLKPGGRLVYSTCSLSTEENDIVINRAVKKLKGLVVVDAFDSDSGSVGVRTECGGCLILPDDKRIPGWGPIFYCVLVKRSANDTVRGSDSENDSDADSDGGNDGGNDSDASDADI